jgi:hypothetical protein
MITSIKRIIHKIKLKFRLKKWFKSIIKYYTKLFFKETSLVSASGEYLDNIGNISGIPRMLDKEKSKDFPTPYYGPVTGLFLGYQESNDHFRKRVLEYYKHMGFFK